MSRIELSGVVTPGDDNRVYDDQLPGAIRVGDADLVKLVLDEDWTTRVRALVDGREVASGDLWKEMGWGYSEYTPMDDDELKVGGIDLIEILKAYEGQVVTVVLEDY